MIDKRLRFIVLLALGLIGPVYAEHGLSAGPYVLCSQRDQVVVYWHTNTPVPSILEYGTSAALGLFVRDHTPKQSHQLVMPVQADVTYYYRLHGTNQATETFQFDATFAYNSEPVPAGPPPYPEDRWTSVYAQAAEFIVAQYGQNPGICVDYGCGLGRLAWEIARRSRLRIIGFNDDPQQVMRARQILDDAGVYGTQIVIHEADLSQLACRDYLANLIVSEQMLRTGTMPGTASEMFRILRPDGGLALLGAAPADRDAVASASLPQWLGDIEHSVDQTQRSWTSIRRDALPGAGTWDHFYANPANTATSQEAGLTNALQLLWYGQPGPRHITDRHNRPMASLYREGIMVTPGLDRLMAYDAYNGTRYWDMVIPGSTRVAVLRDSAWVALAPNRVYLAHRQNCVALDLKTGIPQQHFVIPPAEGQKANTWGYVSYQDDRLYGSSQQASASVIGQNRPRIMAFSYGDNRPIGVSESVFCRDRHTGKLRWTYGADRQRVIINPSISLSKTAMVFLESTHPAALSADRARIPASTLLTEGHAFLVSLDSVTGVVQWCRPVTLPFQHAVYLQIAEEQNLIIATGARDLKGKIHYDMHAFLMPSGQQEWTSQFATDYDVGASHGEQEQHPVIVNNKLYTKYCQVDLRDGSVEPSDLGQATSGCGTLSACATHVFGRGANPFMFGLPRLFRESPPSARERVVLSPGKDGEAGDIGLIVDGAGYSQAVKGPLEARATFSTEPTIQGTRLTGETRPGCWINIFPVGGLVMVPESSSGCSCDFPIQATMAFQPVYRSEAPADE